ncbi:MAG: hydrolase [Betaproteobacteria bacterium]|nr:hydrolase [Betaproteobacteria bacterium]
MPDAPSPPVTEAPAYRAPRWLPGGHAQTIHAATWTPRAKVNYWRERWSTPDFDFIDLDWVDTPSRELALGEADDTPLIVLLHGLEGSSNSHYARAFMHAVDANAGRGVVVHFRGCSGELNRLPRAYHSGDSAELDWILRRLRAQRASPIFVIGVSVGGNVLLKWLGEQGEAAGDSITRAAAISVPFDLGAAADQLARGFNRIYTRHFLKTMKAKTVAKMKNYQALCDAKRVRRARTLREFDDAVTAPLHGFKGADDYYTRSSCKQYLARITVNTLIINARNDPFLPPHCLPARDSLPACVELDTPQHGGHVGFVGGRFPGNIEWLTQRVLHFFARALDG